MVNPSASKPIPAIIGTLFGGLWALITAMAAPGDWQAPIVAISALVTAFLIWRLWTNREVFAAAGNRLFGRKAYRVAVVAEVLAIYAASTILPRFGLQNYFIQTVGIIVGLHFIGLWRATNASRFLFISGAMCAVSALAMFFPPTVGLFHLRNFLTGVGNALVLWIGAGQSPARRT